MTRESQYVGVIFMLRILLHKRHVSLVAKCRNILWRQEIDLHVVSILQSQ